MAIENYNNAALILTDNLIHTLYTAPVNKTSIVHALFFSNTAALDDYITVIVSKGNSDYIIGNNIKVRKNTSLSWDKPINVLSGDSIKIKSSNVAGEFTSFASILELEFGV